LLRESLSVSTGSVITVASATDSALNGTVSVTYVNANTYTFQTSGTGANGTLTFTPIIWSSYGISSVTKNGTGDYTLTFSTAMADANYLLASSVQYRDDIGYQKDGWEGVICSKYVFTTASARVTVNIASTSSFDCRFIQCVFWGN
jgi:hypothetical protein